MALNLSEGRRLAQRRVMSQPKPPRLAPLPTDNTVAGTLRHQLEQQRRVSKTLEAGQDQGRRAVSSSGRQTAPLQPAFEPIITESSFRYNFSNSTWARAQKAKDYMELLAQYRRVSELLPPLKANSLSKVPTSELSPSMPMSLDSVNATGQIGRPYNPLQYIRNRKVRARERKAIDGESQGFGDVNRVTDWVDDVAKWVATRQIRTPGSPALPPFSSADILSVDTSPSTQMVRSAAPMIKPKRPRNDWTVEPADMLADVYWLEQDDHKRLVEDRNWRRVFPQDSELYRPLSRATNDASPALVFASPPLQQGNEVDQLTGKVLGDSKMHKADNDNVLTSTKEKARQKLQEIRGFHRHHTASGEKRHSHIRHRSASTSSSSDSDSQNRSRKSMSGDVERDILERQLMEMMAREANEAQPSEVVSIQEPELRPSKTRPSDINTRTPSTTLDSALLRRQHSRREYRNDASDMEDKKYAVASAADSPQHYGRESLEVPSFQRGRRMSFTSESSAPNSPDYGSSVRDNYFMPGIGTDVSPASSRAGSPSRNPISRMKNMFRDRKKESNTDSATKSDSRLSSTPLLFEKPLAHSRTSSNGPDFRLSTRPTGESHKSHKKSNSARLGDSGLRNLFKGPRIDSVLKSGVSRMSDLLWKKDSEAEDSDSSTSLSGISDDEHRGRQRNTISLSISPTTSLKRRGSHLKQEKHYLDVMPPFVPAAESQNSHSRSGSLSAPLSSVTSSRPSRFELLKPPRIDISAASDTSDLSKGQDMDHSDAETHLDRIDEYARVEDKRSSLVVRPRTARSVSAASIRSSRHFSMTEKDISVQNTVVSRREVARLRAMVLSSGVMALEISRRAHETSHLAPDSLNEHNGILEALGRKLSWHEITTLAPADQRQQLLSQPVSQAELFPVAADILRTAIHSSREHWQAEAEAFSHHTRVELIDGRIEALRARIQLDLSSMTRAAAEEADEVGGDLVDGQRRKVKTVVDVIDKLSRRRRRRFRWVRRAGWLALEWVLVGLMWYVWFVVMIARIFLGVGKGFVRGLRWLLWL
ncbi:hypothetical protein BD289DRAFT_363346 [Coniella lustricola]|uniref:Uncharacterized protein n=1 Tax=Coniella lustricola TaxID=2025994 RepID=A0A2T3AFB0_9PEZI|nr:hypothetical protein BD289DRAFT_363346 [Coniella lustricola]